MRVTREGDVGPNRRLRQLFANGYCSRMSVSITHHAHREKVPAWEDLRRQIASALEALWEAERVETLKDDIRAEQRLSAKPESSRFAHL